MNHLAGFQQLNAQLCREVAALRVKGYYGDGMYSAGSRLMDSAQIAGRGLGATDYDLPEYMCGGAQERGRASTLRRAPRRNGVPRTKRRKAGTRVTSKYAFLGEGNALNAHVEGEEEKKKGTGFRKSTQSAKERQARLEATERRLKGIQQPSEQPQEPTADSDSDSDADSFKETDDLRRKLLADSGTGWKFDIVLESEPQPTDNDIIDLISDDESSISKAKISPTPKPGPSVTSGSQRGGPSLSNLVRNEIEYRKREQLGLVGERKLGGGANQRAHRPQSRLLDLHPASSQKDKIQPAEHRNENPKSTVTPPKKAEEWACLVCTW
ncbi:WLM domain containing protein [Ceratobasidium theobromae]|uniref:WLM domain containing protein n=1 Tax=Ceratobasidium theobromae TaxID=1582974 RepID=A0A5N5QKF3_9AGAM|nr:WLM domain containing protein [Ceratobasidium theobromae]